MTEKEQANELRMAEVNKKMHDIIEQYGGFQFIPRDNEFWALRNELQARRNGDWKEQ